MTRDEKREYDRTRRAVTRVQARERYRLNPEPKRASVRKWQAANPEPVQKWSAQRGLKTKVRRLADPETARAVDRARWRLNPNNRSNTLHYKYGLRREEWDLLFQQQKKKCRCCGSRNPRHKNGWQTDHVHGVSLPPHERWRLVRGILCHRCNVVIGWKEFAELPVTGKMRRYLSSYTSGLVTAEIARIKGYVL